MAELIRLTLTDLYKGDRLRPVDMDVAAAIAASFEDRGQISPVTVRRTPAKNKGATPYTLVAGAHRCAAAEIINWTELDAIVVQADGVEAQLIEIAENLYRNELSALDRAMFVLKYRELWEEKHGKITRGGDTFVSDAKGSNGHDAPLVFARGRDLAKDVQERLGFGPDTYKRAVRIGQNLHPTLRTAVRGMEAAGDQTQLLKLAKLPADDQVRLAAALREKPDLKLALSWLQPGKPAVDEQAEIFRKVAALLDKADDATLRRVLDHIGEKRDLSFLEAAQ